jgi:hypothetical protein
VDIVDIASDDMSCTIRSRPGIPMDDGDTRKPQRVCGLLVGGRTGRYLDVGGNGLKRGGEQS